MENIILQLTKEEHELIYYLLDSSPLSNSDLKNYRELAEGVKSKIEAETK